ncbi:MAG: ABC transporter substrate-binding protein [Eubacteriales bacterium]
MTRILPILLIVSLLLSGCGALMPAEDDAQIEQQIDVLLESYDQETTQEVDDSFALGYNPSSPLHPHTCTDYSNQALVSLMYQSLYVVDSSFHAHPQLASSYTVSADGMTHQIAISGDLSFSDGSPLTILDVIDSLNSANAKGVFAGRLYQITSIESSGLYTMTITTAVPMEQLPQLLNIPIVKSETLADDVPVGSGNYTLSMTMQRLTTDTPLGSLPHVIPLVTVTDATNIRDNFSYGDIDLVFTDPNDGSRVPYLADFELWSVPTTNLQYIGFQTNGSVFNNAELRRAITYAIDRSSIVTTEASGFAVATTLPISPNAPGYDPVLAEDYEYNLGKFQQILTDASIEDMDEDGLLDRFTSTSTENLEIRFITASDAYQRTATAQRIADQLTQLGFVVTLDLLTQSDYSAALQSGNYDMYLAEARLSPNFDLTPFFEDGGSLSYGGIAQDTMVYLCGQFLENSGNGYNLHKAVMDSGFLCPILVKTNALYTTRGKYSGFAPCLNHPFWEVTS